MRNALAIDLATPLPVSAQRVVLASTLKLRNPHSKRFMRFESALRPIPN